MSRTTRYSSGSSGSNEVQEDDHNAIAGSTPDLAERIVR
jgi:hypothetical protein